MADFLQSKFPKTSKKKGMSKCVTMVLCSQGSNMKLPFVQLVQDSLNEPS